MAETGWGRLRTALTAAEGRAAPLYGLFAGVAVALPLFAGSLRGQAAQGVIVALGAYLVAVRAPEGTYGEKARKLFTAVAGVGVGSLIGGLLTGHRWPDVLILPLLVFVGVLVPRIGLTVPLATLFAGIRPPSQAPVQGALLSLAGALFMMLLVLTPWPGRRLRPLTEALSEAVRRIADALEVVTAEPGSAEWDRRRRLAAEAIGRARSTYGMYQASSDDARPGRLIRTLVRLMHEVVGLRSLIEAEYARPVRADLAADTRASVGVLVTRVQLLAAAIAAPRTPRPGPVAPRSAEPAPPGALSQLGERVDQVRREAFAGDEDMVAAALAAQAWRALRRLNSTLDAAGRLVAAGIMVRIGVPRLPDLPEVGPTSLWRRVADAVRTRPQPVRQAARTSLAMLVAMAVWAVTDIPHGHWLPLATLMCLRGTYGETVDRVLQRIGGTALGSVIAALLLALAPGQVTLAAVVFLLAVFGFALSPVSHLYWVVLCTPLVMMIVDFAEPVPWSAAGVRIGLTVAGSLLALVAARLLWPAAGTAELPAALSRMGMRHAAVVRAAAAGDQGAPPLADTLREARRAAEAVTAIADRMALDPLPDTALIGRLRAAVAAAHRIRDEVIAVTGAARSESAGAGPVTAILEEVADHLEESAEALRSGDAGTEWTPELEIDELLADLDGQLSSLARRRRAEVAGGVDLDDTTPLRKALLSVAAVRHAVRELRSDAQDLTRALHL